jgi:sugar phosphate isomerase/epimerase
VRRDFLFLADMSDILDRLSLSTCWCSSRHQDGYEMVEEMVGLGFKRIELSHGIRILLVPGILRAVEEGLVEISSVHNFCPLPNAVQHAAPNLYRPSAKDQRERDLWFRYSMQTLDFATKVGAPHVVMHSGNIDYFFWSHERRLERWIEKTGLEAHELAENEAFRKGCDRAIKRISRSSKPWLDRVEAAYKTLFAEAKERNLKLGAENRESMEELPLDAEFGAFFERFDDEAEAPIGYWHDAGHAQIKHQFGLLDHAEHLEKLSSRLIGFHLHDVSDSGQDHQPIGSGTIDFEMVAKHVRPEHTLVLELSPKLSVEEVLSSRDHIAAVLSK